MIMLSRGGILCIVFLLFTVPLCATLPKDAIVIEGESLTPENAAWAVKDHWDNWYYGHPSNVKMLAGNNATPGNASTTFELPQSDTYHLWVRYLDILDRRGEANAFTITVAQDGKTLNEETFDKESLRRTEKGRNQYGAGWGQFVWQSMPFTAEKGNGTLTVSKPKAVEGNRHIDLFIITSNGQYKADVRDAHPVFVKIRILPEQEKPCIIQIDGRRSEAPVYFLPTPFIHRDGITAGGNMFDPKFSKLEPGQSSPWIPLHRRLSFHYQDMVVFSAQSGPNQSVQNAAFEISFSKTPDDSGIFRTETRQGSGSGMIAAIRLVTGEVLTDRVGSERSLAKAQATTSVEGSRPVLFPFLTQMDLKYSLSQREYVQNELDALSIIGVNGLHRSYIVHPDFPFMMDARFIWTLANNDCQNNPNIEVMNQWMKDFSVLHAKKPCKVLDLMDEPSFEVGHIINCDHCTEAFQKYVAEQGFPMEGKPSFNPNGNDPARYYWSKRFQCYSMAKFFGRATHIVHKYMPDLPTASNFSVELIFDGNMVNRGTDWFTILRNGALTCGFTEDWNSYTGTYQTAGFQVDVLRAACRPKGYPYGLYNILDGRPAWDITAKGFCEIGHGSQFLHFYNYGPYYAPTCEGNSYRAEIYQAIKNLTYPTGAVEKYLTDPAARPAKGDAAMLVSVTSDIWGDRANVGNAYGRERIYLHLLLTHCGYRTDVLSEEDLETDLAGYSVLFVTDSHLRSAYLKPLADWVKAGGTLYLGAGALEYDEYHQPLKADELLGIAREPMNLVQKGGNAEHDLCHRQPVRQIGGISVFVGHQKPYNHVFNCGEGKVLFSGAFPGLSYIASSKQINNKVYSARSFESVYRDYIRGLDLPIQPRLYTDNPLVEAGWIESPEADVIAVSNWTGTPQTVAVTLRDVPQFDHHALEVIGGACRETTAADGNVSIKLDVEAGCYILLPNGSKVLYNGSEF